MKYKYIIWDLDGTLLDTLQDLYLATNHALRTYSMPERTLEEVRRFVGNGVRKLMERAVPEGEQNAQFEQVFCEFKTYYMHHCQDNTKPYEGMIEALHTLKAAGYRMAIVSNKLQAGVDELHEQLFKGLIDVPVGERPGMQRKPAPDMVHLAMKELGATQSDTVYIGDSEVDVATARNAGLPCIAVLWGFRSRDTLVDAGASKFVITAKDLVAELTDAPQQ